MNKLIKALAEFKNSWLALDEAWNVRDWIQAVTKQLENLKKG